MRGTQRGRWGASLAAIAMLAIAPSTGAAADPPGKPTAKAEAPRYLYLTTLTADKPDAETEALFDAIDNAVLTGVRLATSRSKAERRYDDVLSYRRIYAEARATVAPTLRELSLYATRDLGREIEAARTKIPKGSPIHLLKPVIFRGAGGELRVDLELYDPDGMKLLAVKSAGGCGEMRDEVLERLRQAAERIGGGGEDHAPIAVTGLTPAGDLNVGTPVILDGCRSADPDHDALAWTWRQTRAPDGVQVLPSSGYPGRRLRFVPEVAGVYTFELELRQVVGGKIDRVARSVLVSEPPHAVPGPSHIVERTGERIVLHAGGVDPDQPQLEDYAWIQVGGPNTVMTPASGKQAPDGTSTRCAGPRCSFVPAQTGLYTFELSASAGGVTDRKRVSILVAPPPTARLRTASFEARAGIPVSLDGSGSSDALDEKPTFHWEIIDAQGDAALHDHDRAAVDFVSNTLGDHRVRLRVCARRALPGQDLASCSETIAHVHVRRPWVTFLGSIAHQWSFGPDHIATSRLLMPSVGFAFQPLNQLDNPWISAITFLLRQPLARVSLVEDPATGTRFGSAAVGGTSTFELGYWLWPPATVELLPHAGFSFAPGTPNEVGFVGGATIAVRLWQRLIGTFDGGYAHVWKAGVHPDAPGREANQLSLSVGLGVRL